MPYDTPYNRMIARNQQATDEDYADYHAYSNQNYLKEGSMGDARGKLRLFPKMVQREFYTPIDYSGGVTNRNMEGNGGPLGRQFNSIALGEDTRRHHNKSAMYSSPRPIGSGYSAGGESGGSHCAIKYAHNDNPHYSSSEECDSDESSGSDEDLDEMYGGGVPNHDQLLKHLSKMKLPKDVHNEICEWLEEMDACGRGLEGRGGIWDWIKDKAKKVGSFVASNIKPIAKFAAPFLKKIPGVASAVDYAKMIPGASGVLSEYGFGRRGAGQVYVPNPETGDNLTDVRTGGTHSIITKFRNANKGAEDKAKALILSKQAKPVTGGLMDPLQKINLAKKKEAERQEKNKKSAEAMIKKQAERQASSTGGAKRGDMMETNENPLIGVPMRKPGFMKSTGLHFNGASLGAGASGGKKRGRPRKVGGSVIGGPSNDPVNGDKISGGRKTGSALFKKKGSFPMESKAGEPLTETQIVTNNALGQGRRRKGGADKKAKSALSPESLRKKMEKLSARESTYSMPNASDSAGPSLKASPLSGDYRPPLPAERSSFSRQTAIKRKPIAVDLSAAPYVGPNPPSDTAYQAMADVLPVNMGKVNRPPVPPKQSELPPRRVKTPPKRDIEERGYGSSGGKLKTLLPGSSFSGGKKTSPWIQHCKAYASAHGVSYKQAMKDAKASYKK